MASRALILAPGIDPASEAPKSLVAAAERAGVAAELVTPASENELRRRLEAGDVGLIYLLAQGRERQAASHSTLELESASGSRARSVNLRHLASLIAKSSTTRLVVLQATEATADLSGFAAALVRHGVPAAIQWPPVPSMPLLGEAARRLFERWQEGSPLTEVASAAGSIDGVESAGSLATGTSPATPAVTTQHTAKPSEAAPPKASESDLLREKMKAQLAEKRAAGQFDVFLCHNGNDKPAVRSIARALRDRGILPWLDEWELPPGQPWQALLEKQIESIKSAAVFVGRAGVGPWQEQELYGFLREFVSRRAPVIPVLLPDAPTAPELPVFLRAMIWVDFRRPESEAMERLEWGITGVRPAFD